MSWSEEGESKCISKIACKKSEGNIRDTVGQKRKLFYFAGKNEKVYLMGQVKNVRLM